MWTAGSRHCAEAAWRAGARRTCTACTPLSSQGSWRSPANSCVFQRQDLRSKGYRSVSAWTGSRSLSYSREESFVAASWSPGSPWLELYRFGFPFVFTWPSLLYSLSLCLSVCPVETPVIACGAYSNPVWPHLDLITFADCTHKVTFLDSGWAWILGDTVQPSTVHPLPSPFPSFCPSHIQNPIPASPGLSLFQH